MGNLNFEDAFAVTGKEHNALVPVGRNARVRRRFLYFEGAAEPGEAPQRRKLSVAPRDEAELLAFGKS